MNNTLQIREALTEPLLLSHLKHPSANLVSFLVFSRMQTAVRTLYLHQIGYLELQIGNGRFKAQQVQHHSADKEAHSYIMESNKAEKKMKERRMRDEI